MATPIIETKGLKKYFNVSRGLLHAVDDVDLSIAPEETLGIVGESGCGKSTLGRVILGLLPATEGEILYNGESIFDARGRKKPNTYKDMQMIFQDPFSSLNPRLSIQDLIAEPIHVQKVLADDVQIKERVLELMDLVGLSERYVNSYPMSWTADAASVSALPARSRSTRSSSSAMSPCPRSMCPFRRRYSTSSWTFRTETDLRICSSRTISASSSI